MRSQIAIGNCSQHVVYCGDILSLFMAQDFAIPVAADRSVPRPHIALMWSM